MHLLRKSLIFAGLSVLTIGVQTAAAHEDMMPALNAPHTNPTVQLITGFFDDGSAISGVPRRVFEADLTPIGDRYIGIQEPGLNAPEEPLGAFHLPPGRQLLMDLVPVTIAGTPSNLFFWDGTGSVNFLPATGLTLTLEIQFQSTRTVDATNTVVSGFNWGFTDNPEGTMHVHTNTIVDDVGSPDAFPAPPAGIYLLPAVLRMPGTNPTVFQSDTIFFVYAADVDEEIHEAATDWVTDHLLSVPEPSGLAIALAGAIAVAAIARRRRAA